MVQLERQAITTLDLTRIPRRPGPTSTVLRCKQGHIIGMVEGAWLFQRHQGRESVSALPAEIRCDRCGRYTLVDTPTV